MEFLKCFSGEFGWGIKGAWNIDKLFFEYISNFSVGKVLLFLTTEDATEFEDPFRDIIFF